MNRQSNGLINILMLTNEERKMMYIIIPPSIYLPVYISKLKRII